MLEPSLYRLLFLMRIPFVTIFFNVAKEHGIHPLFVQSHANNRLHCLLDGDDAGSITLLKHRNGGDDICLVRHHDDNKEEKSDNE